MNKWKYLVTVCYGVAIFGAATLFFDSAVSKEYTRAMVDGIVTVVALFVIAIDEMKCLGAPKKTADNVIELKKKRVKKVKK